MYQASASEPPSLRLRVAASRRKLLTEGRDPNHHSDPRRGCRSRCLEWGLADTVRRNAFHTVRFTERGYGNSPRSTQPYSSTDDIGNLMGALQIKRATLVGSSANGGRAIAFALKHPEVVDIPSLLHGPAVPGIPYSEDFIRLLTPFGERVMKNDIFGGIAVEQYPYFIAPRNRRREIREFITSAREHPQDHNCGLCKSGMRPIGKGELKMGTLIIVDISRPRR